MSWCITGATRPVSRLAARSRSTSSCSITGSGDILDWEIAQLRHVPFSGPVISWRREVVIHGVHY